jgi:hypothetical protein
VQENTGGRLDVWSLDDGRHVAGSRPSQENLFLPHRGDALLVDRAHLLVTNAGNTALWHLPDFRRLYHGRSLIDSSARLAPDRRTWLSTDSRRFVSRDVLTGEPRSALPNVTALLQTAFLQISPDGTRIVQVDTAFRGGATYRIRNLRDGTATPGHPIVRKAFPHWCGNSHVVQFDSGEGRDSFDRTRTDRWEIFVTEPVRNVVVRGYELRDGYPIPDTDDGLTWYVCRAAEGSELPVLCGVRLPEPEAIAAVPEEPLPDPAVVFARTDPVSLVVQPFSTPGATDLSERVRKKLETILATEGHPVRDGARAVLHVGFKEAPTGETATFRPFGGRGQNQTVAVVRLEANLSLRIGDEVAWTDDFRSDGVGFGFITLRDGETIEQHLADSRARVVPELLDRLDLPGFVRRRDAPPPPSWRRLTADGVK